jgi:nitroreductase
MVVIPTGKAEPPGAEFFECGIIAENIALAATSIGIDNLVCGIAAFSFAGDRNDEFKRRLGFPDGFEIGLTVLLGYAAYADGKPHAPDYGKISYIE